jgi:hypothetical protein
LIRPNEPTTTYVRDLQYIDTKRAVLSRKVPGRMLRGQGGEVSWVGDLPHVGKVKGIFILILSY